MAEPIDIEEYVTLKRGQYWVKRYAKVCNQIFSYKKEKGKLTSNVNGYLDSSNMVTFMDLRIAKVK